MSNENIPIIMPWDLDDISNISNIEATSVVLEQILLEPFFDARFLQEGQENAESAAKRNQ